MRLKYKYPLVFWRQMKLKIEASGTFVFACLVKSYQDVFLLQNSHQKQFSIHLNSQALRKNNYNLLLNQKSLSDWPTEEPYLIHH